MATVVETNLATNPSFEVASGEVETTDGVEPTPLGVVNDGDAIAWQSALHPAGGAFSLAIEWLDPAVGPLVDKFRVDTTPVS